MNDSLKSLLPLWEVLAGNRRYSDLISERDLSTFRTRAENEGLLFLTTVLPNLGKSLDYFHSSSVWRVPARFKCDSHGIPYFMGDPIRAALSGDSSAVDCVRQLSYMFYKLEVPYDQTTVSEFLDRFVKTDEDLQIADDSSTTLGLIDAMGKCISRILCNTDPTNIRPCHGGGSTACHTANSEKWHTIRYFPKLDAVYPYSDLFFYSPTHLADRLDELEGKKEGVPRARVCLVPKDSRGPRVISCEPAELMYAQQGIMRLLYATLEAHPSTSGQINFSDQSINRSLARVASITGGYATIDLSDASDRVSLDLVSRIFPAAWTRCLLATRSEETTLPDKRVVKLKKFAPMGSSCCFPVEALTFWACAREAIYQDHGIRPEVFVYGDDIIVESQFYDSVVRGLTAVGLMVNYDKSYWKGPFRESCGGDYHNGYDVTPVRVRKFPVSSSTGFVAGADFLNEIIEKFGYESAHKVIVSYENSIGVQYPRTQLPLPGTLRIDPGASNDVLYRRRWNTHLQRYEYRIQTLSCKVSTKHLPDWEEVLRKELTREDRQSSSDRYQSQQRIADSLVDPGQYADIHSVRKKWSWAWLG